MFSLWLSIWERLSEQRSEEPEGACHTKIWKTEFEEASVQQMTYISINIKSGSQLHSTVQYGDIWENNSHQRPRRGQELSTEELKS